MLDSKWLPSWIKVSSWILSTSWEDMIVWYLEAQMMIREWLIKWVWSELTWFFWVPKVKIAWILEPTWTFIDDTHILNSDNFNKLSLPEDLLITQTPFWEMKYFYLFDGNNIPERFKTLINPKKLNFDLNNKRYLAAYIWYNEAQMMIEEKLFSKTFDKIEWLFWNDIIVAWLPKKTYTLYDMFHFVPKEFKDNYLKTLEVK